MVAVVPLPDIDEETIDRVVDEQFGMSGTSWALDLAASLRGLSGRLPISASAIATSLGIPVVVEPAAGYYGSLNECPDGSMSISICDALSPEEENFTIAHELGHELLHRASGGALRSGDDVERFCDLFAAHLLCPLSFVNQTVKTKRLTMATVTGLARSLVVPRRKLLELIASLYPVTYFWGNRAKVQQKGAFSVVPFVDAIISRINAEGSRGSICWILSSAGRLNRWRVDVSEMPSGEFAGLLMPVGADVRTHPQLRIINSPREALVSKHAGVWHVEATASRS